MNDSLNAFLRFLIIVFAIILLIAGVIVFYSKYNESGITFDFFSKNFAFFLSGIILLIIGIKKKKYI